MTTKDWPTYGCTYIQPSLGRCFVRMTYPIQSLPKASHKTTTTKNLARGGSIEGFVWQHPWPHAILPRGRCLEKFRKLPFFLNNMAPSNMNKLCICFFIARLSSNASVKNRDHPAPSQKELPLNKVHIPPLTGMPIIPNEKKTKQLKQQWKAWLSF